MKLQVSTKELYMNDIPKRIFYVWGAGEPKKRDVNLCILTWKQKYHLLESDNRFLLYILYVCVGLYAYMRICLELQHFLC